MMSAQRWLYALLGLVTTDFLLPHPRPVLGGTSHWLVATDAITAMLMDDIKSARSARNYLIHAIGLLRNSAELL